MPTVAENFGYNILEAQLLGLMVYVSKGTTPWDCEFDDYNISEGVHFVELESSAWIEKLHATRKAVCFNDDRQALLVSLSQVRDQQVWEFAERLSK